MKTINVVRGFLVLLLLVAVMTPLTAEQEPAQLHLMPWPASLKLGAGQLSINNSFSLAVHGADPRLRKAAVIFLNDLRRETGMLPLDFTVTDSAEASLTIHSDRPSKEVQELGEDESYKLEVSAAGAKLEAPGTLGAMRGLQTFLQLVRITPQGFAAPVVSIQDTPRFPWRGLLIDPGRHFIPVDLIKRNLDGMAAVKLNVLHWHLSEYQGFRVESKRFPKLHEMGSDGFYYTQDEIRDVVIYARDRGVRIVPEFDMPGHSTSWFVGYPELASGPGPYSIERKWGVFDPAMDPTKESTYKFLDAFVGEMAGLFPDQFFHIGGDEVNGKQWEANPKIQQFMRAHGLKNNADLQGYFNQRLQKIVAKHGKTMEGWDEILRPELPKSIVIQSWRGPQSLADAARQGYRGLLSSGYYLDLMSPTSAHYGVDPFADGAANLSDEEKQRILGGEACMWGEFVSGENIDSRIWPRTAAIAERLWSPQATTDVNSMYDRLDEISHWLDFYGLKHNANRELMLRRMAEGEDSSALRTLADVVEPPKGYSREALATSEPTALTPLNRLIDAAQPESATARRFLALVDLLISGKMKPGTEIQIRALLTKWRDNDTGLRLLTEQSSLVAELGPLSQDLSALGTSGLQALDYLDRGEHPPEAWTSQQLALVQQAFQPKAQVLLMIAPGVQKLIQASAGQTITSMPIPKNAAE